MKKALFPGTFEIFHEGHIHVLYKAKEIFDEIIVVVAINENKNSSPLEKRYIGVKNVLKKLKIPNIKVEMCATKLSDIGKIHNIYHIIRGVRNEKDFLYEKNLLREYKKDLPNFEIVFFICDEEKENISSSNLFK